VALFELDGLPEPVRELGRSIQELALSLGQARVRAQAADGRIVATADLSGNLHEVEISPQAIRELDNLTLGDEVLKAIRAAREEARRRYADGLGSIQVMGSTLSALRTEVGTQSGEWVEEPDNPWW
jgi:DNA-binding protein YbaB